MSDTVNKPIRKHGLTGAQRLEKYRIFNGDCWEITLDRNKIYPQIRIDGQKIASHRIAYDAYVGPIPDNVFVLHKCDNPRCHRPDHLFLGDRKANMQDMAAKGRHRAGPRKEFDQTMLLNLSKVLSQKEVGECLGLSQPVVSQRLRELGASRGRSTSFGKQRYSK